MDFSDFRLENCMAIEPQKKEQKQQAICLHLNKDVKVDDSLGFVPDVPSEVS